MRRWRRAHRFRSRARASRRVRPARGAQAPRVARAHQLVVGEGDDGVAAIELAQRVDEAVLKAVADRAGGELEDDFGVHGGLENGAVLDEVAVQGAGVGDVTVVRDGEAAMGEVGIDWLDVAENDAAGG